MALRLVPVLQSVFRRLLPRAGVFRVRVSAFPLRARQRRIFRVRASSALRAGVSRRISPHFIFHISYFIFPLRGFAADTPYILSATSVYRSMSSISPGSIFFSHSGCSAAVLSPYRRSVIRSASSAQST